MPVGEDWHATRRRAAALAEKATGATSLGARRLAGGHSNTTVAVRSRGGREVVVRLYERQPGVAAVEHAVLRLAARAVPVAEVLLADPAGELTGQPALVQRHVEGRLASDVLAGSGAGTAADVGGALGRTLAGLQRVPFARPGFFETPDLAPHGMPGGLVERLAAYLDVTLAHARRHGADRRVLASWRGLVVDTARRLGAIPGQAVLVHADYNPKNVLLARREGRWHVAAVLDWEFAFAGSWLHDLGNLLRFADDHPPTYTEAIVDGAREAGATLPERWREAAAVLDAFSVADVLARGPGTALEPAVTRLVAGAVRRGSLVSP